MAAVTKIRSTDSSRIQDRRGQGGGGGIRFPGLGRRRARHPDEGGRRDHRPRSSRLAAIFLPKLLGGGQQHDRGGDVGPEVSATSEADCVTEIEQILCGAADDVSEYWIRDVSAGLRQQYREADTIFFSARRTPAAARPAPRSGPFYCPADGLVYFDLDFLDQLQNQFGATGDLAAQYIVAHEYGHHVQNVLGISSKVQPAPAAGPAATPTSYSVALELQADCFAGAWAHDADERGLLDEGEITEALNAAAAVGDDSIQQRAGQQVDPESFTHGSSEQRVSWFRRGYDTGDPQQCDTFAEVL